MGTGEVTVYPWWLDAVLIFLRYFVLAGAAYFVFYIWKQKRFARIKIDPKPAASGIIRNEFLNSLITLSIYCGISYLIFLCHGAGYTKIYSDISQYGYPYLFLSVALMIVLHDAYFYWTHRLMHLPGWFKLVHRQHHLSHNPTPWASFSFHPFEALISVGIIPLIVFVFPAHPLALFLFLTIMTIVNVMGHLGHELFPADYRKGRVGKWQNTATNHHFHHSHRRHNYGLYFTFWDRWMGTYQEKDLPINTERENTDVTSDLLPSSVFSENFNKR
jgi:lathosterol oxidase